MVFVDALPAALLHACVTVAATLGIALPAAALLRRRLTARMHRSTAAGGAGPRGLRQPWADGIKLITKTPVGGARIGWVRSVGLWLALAPPLALLAMVPYSCFPSSNAPNCTDASVLSVLALMAVGGVVPAALGASGRSWGASAAGMRTAGQVVAATLCTAFCLVGAMLMAGSPRLADIVASQVGADGPLPPWNVLLQPLGFLSCAGALMAWCQAPPFDAGPDSPALNGGYRSSCAPAELAWLRVGVHLRQLCAAVLLTVLFLGGGHLPWGAQPLESRALTLYLVFGVFGIKTLAVLTLFVWLGAVLPSLRWDRLQHLLWRRFLPLAIGNLVWVGLLSTVLRYGG